jgi:hypothetical protein
MQKIKPKKKHSQNMQVENTRPGQVSVHTENKANKNHSQNRQAENTRPGQVWVHAENKTKKKPLAK